MKWFNCFSKKSRISKVDLDLLKESFMEFIKGNKQFIILPSEIAGLFIPGIQAAVGEDNIDIITDMVVINRKKKDL